MRRFVLALVLGGVGITGPTCSDSIHLQDRPVEPLWFIHPKTHVALSGVTGLDIPVQVWVLRHKDNRQITIAWSGAGCSGSSSMMLDGQYEAAVYPAFRYLLVRMGPGVCILEAVVYGAGGKVLQRATFEMTIMGPQGWV